MGRLRINPVVLSLVGLFVLSQLPFLLSQRYASWDEAVYLAIGKHIYSAGASGLWEPIRPPGLSLVLGPVWKLHLPYFLSSVLLKFLFSLGAIVLTYLLAKKLFGTKAAILATALLATSQAFFFYSSQIFTEIPSSLFVLAAVYFFSERKPYLSGIAAALAVLFKFTNGILVVAIAASVIALHLAKQGKARQLLASSAQIAVSFAAVVLPFLAFNAFFYRGYSSSLFAAAVRPFSLAAWHQSNPAKAVAGGIYNYSYYFIQLFRQHPALVLAIPALFIFWKKGWYSSPGKNLLASALLFYLAYFSYIPNKDERFLLTFLPLACILAAAGFFEALGWAGKIRSALKPLAVASLITLLIASFSAAAYADYRFYSWRAPPQPELTELYSSVTNLGIKGPVMTSDPAFAAYSDNLFLPYYDSSEGVPAALKPSWDMKAKPFEAVIYSPQTLYCPENDLGCYALRDGLQEQIKSGYKLVFSGSYYGGRIDYYIYVNESFISS